MVRSGVEYRIESVVVNQSSRLDVLHILLHNEIPLHFKAELHAFFVRTIL